MENIPNLKLNKYCFCITDQKCGWQAVFSLMESVIATAKPPMPSSSAYNDKNKSKTWESPPLPYGGILFLF